MRLRAAAAEHNLDDVVLGSLTPFAGEQKKKRIGGFLPKPFLLGGYSRDQAQLKVGVSFRIVDVRTGEVVATAAGEGLSTRRAVTVLGGGVVNGLPLGGGGGTERVRLSAARDAMLSEAVQCSVHAAAQALAAADVNRAAGRR